MFSKSGSYSYTKYINSYFQSCVTLTAARVGMPWCYDQAASLSILALYRALENLQVYCFQYPHIVGCVSERSLHDQFDLSPDGDVDPVSGSEYLATACLWQATITLPYALRML